MSDSEKKVECSIHGSSSATFVCQHLINGDGLGFNIGYDPDCPDDLYPDAWCNECDKVWDEEGEWNDRSEEFANIKLLCAQCYENARDKNWLEDEDKMHELISSGFQYLQEKQQGFIDKFKINDHERWDWYQETGKLIFTHDGKPQVEADIQFAGTFSKNSNTWMWAWANQHLDETVKPGSRKVREIGAEFGIRKLVAGHWSATEVDGWEMTAVLAKALNGIGAYRTKSDNGFVYMVITDAKWLL